MPSPVDICVVSPDVGEVERIRKEIAERPDWEVTLVYDTCDAQTLLVNLHRFVPACVLIDLDLGQEAVASLTAALARAGYHRFLFLASPSATNLTSGEIVLKGAPIGSIVAAVTRLTSRPQRQEPRKGAASGVRWRPVVIAIHSPKGGTGKTLLACSLAVQYASRGIRTLLVDLALYGGVAPSLGLPRREKGLTGILDAMDQSPDVLEQPDALQIIRSNLVQCPAGEHHLDLLLAGPPLRMSTLDVAQTESLLQWLVAEPYGVVIIDTSSEIAERTIAAMKIADYVLLTMTPELQAAWALLAMQDLLKNLSTSGKLQVALNRSVPGLKLRDLEEAVGHPVVAQIPEASHPWENAVGKNLSYDYSAFGMALKHLAQRYYNTYAPREIPTLKR